MKQVLLIAFFANIVPAFSQTETEVFVNAFDNRKNKLQHDGMVVLGSWASANIIGSAIGYGLSTSNEEKEFYIMNGSWGLINLGLAPSEESNEDGEDILSKCSAGCCLHHRRFLFERIREQSGDSERPRAFQRLWKCYHPSGSRFDGF